jgi:hypothetical protein
MHYRTYAKSIQIFEFLSPTGYMSIPMVGMLAYVFFFEKVKSMYHTCSTKWN